MKVQVYIYDLSMGLASQLSTMFLGKHIEGVWHTGVVVFGKEYFFGGSGIEYCQPGGTGMGQPLKIHDLGETYIPTDVFQEYLMDLREKFGPQTYNLFENNCNNFSNEIAQFLTGKGIPNYITNLPKEVMETPFGRQLRPMLEGMQNRPGSTLLQSVDSSNTVPTVPTDTTPIVTVPTTINNTATSQPSSTTTSTTSQSSTSTTSQSSTTTNSTTDSKTGFSEANIRRIINNGFTKSEAIEELEQFSGDTDKALASLLNKAIKFS